MDVGFILKIALGIVLGVVLLVGLFFLGIWIWADVSASRAVKRERKKEIQEFLEWERDYGNPNIDINSDEGIQEFCEWKKRKFSS